MLDKSPQESQPTVVKNFADLGALLDTAPEETDSGADVSSHEVDTPSSDNIEKINLTKDEYFTERRPEIVKLLNERGRSEVEANAILEKSLDIEFNQESIDYSAVARIIDNLHNDSAETASADTSSEPSATPDTPPDTATAAMDTESTPSASEMSATLRAEANESLVDKITDVVTRLEAAAIALDETATLAATTQAESLREYTTKLHALQQRLAGLPSWESDQGLLLHQQENTAAQIEAVLQNAVTALDVAAADSVIDDPDSGAGDASISPVTAPRTGWWDKTFQERQQLDSEVKSIPTAIDTDDSVTEKLEVDVPVSNVEGAASGTVSALDQRYEALMTNPLVALTDDEKITLQTVYENYQRIQQDESKSLQQQEQAAQNLSSFIDQAVAEPTSLPEVVTKMDRLRTFLEQHVTTALTPTETETINAMQSMYESVTQREEETEADYVSRKAQQYKNIENFVTHMYQDGKLSTDQPLVLREPVAPADSESYAAEEPENEAVTKERQETLEADFTQAVQHHIHNLRLLLEAEGKGPRFSSVTSNGPLKLTDITRWLEVSEKKYRHCVRHYPVTTELIWCSGQMNK